MTTAATADTPPANIPTGAIHSFFAIPHPVPPAAAANLRELAKACHAARLAGRADKQDQAVVALDAYVEVLRTMTGVEVVRRSFH